jgi:sec-independent protein translocase protein TatB
MIDLGLTKLAIIGVVALIVIGPEKLPKVARMAGTLYGRAQRYLNEVKSEVSREIELEELRNLHKEVQDAAQILQVGCREFHVEQSVSSHERVESAWRGDKAHAAAIAPAHRHARRHRAQGARLPPQEAGATPPSRPGTSTATAARQHVLSGAARVRKFRPGGKSNTSFF